MSRSYKKNPFTKGRHSSWKWDRSHSARLYRRFVKQKLCHEKYDEIHNKYKTFWNWYNWSPDYICYMGDYKNPTLGAFSHWYIEWQMRKKKCTYEEACEQILEEKREDYKKCIRK